MPGGFAHPLWSNDSKYVLVVARETEGHDTLYVTTTDGLSRRIEAGVTKITNAISTGRHFLIEGINTKSNVGDASLYLVDPLSASNQAKKLALSTTISQMIAVSLDFVAGINHGKLVMLDCRSGSIKETQFSERFASILFPRNETVRPDGNGYVLAVSDKGEHYLLSDPANRLEIRKLVKPRADAQLTLASSDSAVYVSHGADGTRVYAGMGSEPSLKLELNSFLSQIAQPKVKDLKYLDASGKERTAKIFLPPNSVTGTRYPTLTWVYINQEPTDDDLNPNNTYFLNLAVALGHGYAVLKPTINPERFANKGEPYGSLPQYVLPAVKAAISGGYADPTRVYLAGHSYGAYSTYALVTQTDVFAAAAAINGPSSLLDEYLSINPNIRYETYSFSNQVGVQSELETEHRALAMGVTPWQDFDLYVRNSPIRFADRTSTPLLIVHSDSDVFDMHMADAFYLALLRFGKPAAYMQFWGESHSFDSPGNISALWKEIFGWFDSHSK